MKKLLIFFTFTYVIFCNSYEGKGIVGNTKITMILNIDNNFVYGSYYYNLYKTPILITGSLNNESLILNESDNKFEGILKNGIYKGIWYNSDKAIPFDIKIKKNNFFKNYHYENKSMGALLKFKGSFYTKNNNLGKIINNFIFKEIYNYKLNLNIKGNFTSDYFKNFLDKSYKIFANDYLIDKKNNEKMGYIFNPSEFSKSSHIIYEDLNYFSILTVSSSYWTGASRSNGNINILNINKLSGETIEARDIFNSEYEKYLFNKIKIKYTYLENNLTNFKENILNNLIITQKGLVFIYNPYGWGNFDYFEIYYDEIDDKHYNKNYFFYKSVIKPRLNDKKNYKKLPEFNKFINFI